MARGAEAKLRRKNERKEAKARAAEELLNSGNRNDFDSTPADEQEDVPLPTPPGMANDDDSDSDNEGNGHASSSAAAASTAPPMMMTKKKKRSTRSAPNADSCCTPGGGGGGGKGIKPLPLIMLLILTGTTVLPALLYMGDWAGAFLQKNHVFGSIGYKLGVGPSPKKRVLSFYEKHDPEKIPEVPKILGKYYGDYPKLVKKLERKYGDYGYFLNWEQDEAPMKLALEQLSVTRDYLLGKWNMYAPQFLKNAARNIKHNLTFLYKRGKRVWKKQVWPHLEPIFGVPEGGEKQKRKDAAEARARKGQRRKANTEFRDDVDDEWEG